MQHRLSLKDPVPILTVPDTGELPITDNIIYAGVAQWLGHQPSKLGMRVRFSSPAPITAGGLINMGVNTNGKCVVKDWVWTLSWKQQAALLSALRGCDTADKYDASKPFIRRLRGIVLENGGTDSAEFMQSSITDEDIYQFTKSLDKYPIHFILHLIHASEIVGYNLPNEEQRIWWYNLYETFVHAFHMNVESKEQNDARLRDGVDTCCHKT